MVKRNLIGQIRVVFATSGFGEVRNAPISVLNIVSPEVENKRYTRDESDKTDPPGLLEFRKCFV